MKLLLGFLLSCASTSCFSWDCLVGSIKREYTESPIIFYGRYLNTDTIEGYYDLSGHVRIVENFEVIEGIKGFYERTLLYYKEENRPYIISLVSDCGTEYGSCFSPQAMYLIYARERKNMGELFINTCSRSRAIMNNDFIASVETDPDYQQDELKVLYTLLKDADLNKENPITTSQLYLREEQTRINYEQIQGKYDRTLKALVITLCAFGLLLILVIVKWKSWR